MDFRYNYDTIRSEIDRADFGEFIDSDSLLVKNIKSGMHLKIDLIEELEDQKRDLDEKIKAYRKELMVTAKSWDI